MKNYYEVLGLTPDATNEEIQAKYQELKAKYSEDRFLEGEAGTKGAKNLTELENAYKEIISERNQNKENIGNEENAYAKVSKLLAENNLEEAQRVLDSFDNRDAEWHYYQSFLYYKKNWLNESKKQLEIAMNLNANEPKYKQEYDKLNAKMNAGSNQTYNSQGGYYNGNPNGQPRQQMGGEGGCGELCNWCTTMCCLNMCINMFCCR